MIGNYYNLFRALHVIAVIHWMAGMICLPLVYSYHTKVTKGSDTDQLFQRIEYYLLRYLMNHAMVIVLIFGLMNAYYYGFSILGWWFQIKMISVAALITMHGFLASCREGFAKHINRYSARTYLIISYITMFSIIIAVVMVILKPFD